MSDPTNSSAGETRSEMACAEVVLDALRRERSELDMAIRVIERRLEEPGAS